MSNAIKTVEYKGYTIEIIPDSDPINPRTNDNLTVMVSSHKSFCIDDDGTDYDRGNYDSWDDMEKAIIKNERAVVIKPLYLYDHSGQTIRTSPFSCNWDSGQIGFVWISREKALEGLGLGKGNRISKKQKIQLEKNLEGEVKEYDDYLTGNVFGFKISKDGVDIESCWGFAGDDANGNEWALVEAKSIVDHLGKAIIA